jgi:hypothetical protein
MKIAIVGTGISGLARRLSIEPGTWDHNIRKERLYRWPYPFCCPETIAVDSGLIIYNEVAYPKFY